MFQNAQNFVIKDGYFAHIVNTANIDPVSTTLWQSVAAGAIFDSAERYPPGKCHPGTRQGMIDKITQWISDPNPAQRVLWLHGPAGSGKSALAHSICELLEHLDPAKNGGSFFFSRGSKERGNNLKLVTTLSYQLALRFPSMRSDINQILLHDPSLPTKDMETQLVSLIIQPLLRCQPLLSDTPTIIIDGLDECADSEGLDTHRTIINLIAKSVLDYNIPLRFMIACRPESWIRDTFEASPLSEITLSLSLRDDIDADKDIKAYLTDQFEKIRMKNKRIMASVESPWPPTHIIDHFVYEASGQYIYASTVLKFVGNFRRFSNPLEQLRILISPGTHRALVFSELDRLYASVLAAYPRIETLKRVLGGFLAGANHVTIEVVLGIDRTELMLVLDALSSVLDMQKRELSDSEKLLEPIFGSLSDAMQRISISHMSFREFLEDESRSGLFYVNVKSIQEEITRAFLDIIRRHCDLLYEREPHVYLNIDLVRYHLMISNMTNVILAVASRPDPNDVFLSILTDIPQVLLSIDFDRPINYVSCLLKDLQHIRVVSELPRAHRHLHSHPLFQIAVSQVRKALSSVQKRVLSLLFSGTAFQITPTLAYIWFFADRYEPGGYKPVTVNMLFNIPNITIADTLSTLRQHRYLLFVECTRDKTCTLGLHLPSDAFSIDDHDDELRLFAAKWRDQRVLLTCRYLQSMMTNSMEHEWEHYDGDAVQRDTYVKEVVFRNFFDDSKQFGNISSVDFFYNKHNLDLLELMVDPAAWNQLFPLRPNPLVDLETVVGPVLYWFKRQLTNPSRVKLIKEYDQTLSQRMSNAVGEIFHHCVVVPNILTYPTELRLMRFADFNGYSNWVTFKVLPLPQPPLSSEEEDMVRLPSGDKDISRLQHLHDQLFGYASPSPAPSTIFTPDHEIEWPIKRSHWYPCLATLLLKSLVRVLYSLTRQAYFKRDYVDVGKFFSTYIIDSLPYARPTQQNLDALRAAFYFSGKLTPRWRPPVHFSSLTLQLLKRYDRSVLSSEELALFEIWLINLAAFEVTQRKYLVMTRSRLRM